MFNGNGGRGNGGWKGKKQFGAKAPWKKSFSGDDAGRPELNDATCSECGEACRVPFKPNGRKPVFCSKCFIRADKEEGHFERPMGNRSFGEKRPAYQSRERGGGNGEVVALLKEISAKLDELIEAQRP